MFVKIRRTAKMILIEKEERGRVGERKWSVTILGAPFLHRTRFDTHTRHPRDKLVKAHVCTILLRKRIKLRSVSALSLKVSAGREEKLLRGYQQRRIVDINDCSGGTRDDTRRGMFVQTAWSVNGRITRVLAGQQLTLIDELCAN